MPQGRKLEFSMELNEKDVREMVRLLGETAAVSGGHNEKKRFLMSGLAGLIGADSWAWALGCSIAPGGPQMYCGIEHGGFDEEGFPKFLEAIDHPDMGDVTEHFFLACSEVESHVTMLQEEIDPHSVLAQSGALALWQAAGIGHVMMNGYHLDEDSLSTVGLYKGVGKEPFSQRDKAVAHIILEEVKWLHLLGWPEDKGATVPQLYPRQRVVLNLLLDGMIRKEIADHLKISENTVSGYIKEIYKHFGVNSHVELMKKFYKAAAG
jgi:DNA-binding CsgD family transcriptional regulator